MRFTQNIAIVIALYKSVVNFSTSSVLKISRQAKALVLILAFRTTQKHLLELRYQEKKMSATLVKVPHGNLNTIGLNSSYISEFYDKIDGLTFDSYLENPSYYLDRPLVHTKLIFLDFFRILNVTLIISNSSIFR